MIVKAFIDMDGVLADFIGGACEAHELSSPYDMDDLGYCRRQAEKEGKQFADIASMWGMSRAQFWAGCKGQDFWEGLMPLEYGEQIFATVKNAVGLDNVYILSSPSLDPDCIPGKRAWIKELYPEMIDRVIFTKAKAALAGRYNILIDDLDKNCDAFQDAGGWDIVVPQPWNSRVHQIDNRVEYVEERLRQIASGIRNLK